MSTDKSSRTRKPSNSKSNIDNATPSDSTGVEGTEGTQVFSLLTGGSNEPGSTTRSMSSISKLTSQ